MRIVIEIDGEKVTETGPDVLPVVAERSVAPMGGIPPGPAPEALLERARKLGALSAGCAQFGTGAALAAASVSGEEPTPKFGRRSAKTAKKRSRRTS